MVQTKGLRPKGFPAFMGNDFFLIGYRVFVRYKTSAGKRLRGLYILKSETDKKKMEFIGNLFTHYKYTTTDITQTGSGTIKEIGSVISLFTSFYIYDLSNLYKLNWINMKAGTKIINIHAGFEETSHLLREKYPLCDLIVLDFYNPEKHTEISIKRARKVYPPYPGTQVVNTYRLPLENDYADTVFLILSAHEIRSEKERIIFFKELNRILNGPGRIIVAEHSRDWPNWFAYNIGFFHFHSASSWHKTFKDANLQISSKRKITPFITLYTLQKNGDPS